MKQTSWRGALALVLVCALFLVNNAATAAPARDDTTWHAEYFNNRDMSGTPALVREEATIDFDWKLGSPGPQVRADNFSARWTRTVKLEWSGNYRFYMTSDDGMRVWVDNILLIDQWLDRQDAWTTADIYLAEGNHTIKVEYYEHIGAALAKLVFQPEGDGTGGTWKSEYFTNPDLEGDPGLVLSDDHIAFNWGRGSPGEWIPADWFSARYTRDVIFAAGMYQFIVTTQGGVRLYVDDVLILDQWDQVGQRLASEVVIFHLDRVRPSGKINIAEERLAIVGRPLVNQLAVVHPQADAIIGDGGEAIVAGRKVQHPRPSSRPVLARHPDKRRVVAPIEINGRIVADERRRGVGCFGAKVFGFPS